MEQIMNMEDFVNIDEEYDALFPTSEEEEYESIDILNYKVMLYGCKPDTNGYINPDNYKKHNILKDASYYRNNLNDTTIFKSIAKRIEVEPLDIDLDKTVPCSNFIIADYAIDKTIELTRYNFVKILTPMIIRVIHTIENFYINREMLAYIRDLGACLEVLKMDLPIEIKIMLMNNLIYEVFTPLIIYHQPNYDDYKDITFFELVTEFNNILRMIKA